MTLAEIITTGMNNPECSFYVGAFMGQLGTIRLGWLLLCTYLLYKAIDKLAWEPFIIWIKKKVYKEAPK